ncbi:Fic family protein [Sedimenticola hydrogenitrophicus]|uniref:Fic family protein n=1 Tax=Sedimenticola hydrogenitrophicus TaxID=2967975 RepID=UPI0021A8E0B2
MAGDNQFQLRIETDRFGPFTFQLGVDRPRLDSLLLRVDDAHKRFKASPLSRVASRLAKEVVVSSIYGTNSIEGGTLSVEETEQALDLTPAQVKDIEQRRAINLKNAYELTQRAAAQPGWQLDIAFIRQIHAAVTDQLPHEHNRPGLLRDNPKRITTRVGSQEHGGIYKPPQYGKDVERLLNGLVEWHQQLVEHRVPILIRAPLVHLYYELIHPFWDGNGRVGRVLEATLLQAEGYKYAPFAQARYYLEHIHAYFTLFNTTRKKAEKNTEAPNTDFVAFFLDGMLVSINALHDRVNALIAQILFENEVKRLHDEKAINARQYAIVSQIMEAGKPVSLSDLRKAPWYQALYVKLTDKTKQRDLKGLRELGILRQDDTNSLWAGFLNTPTADD